MINTSFAVVLSVPEYPSSVTFYDDTTMKILSHEDCPTDSSTTDDINPKYSAPEVTRNQDVYVLSFAQLEDFMKLEEFSISGLFQAK